MDIVLLFSKATIPYQHVKDVLYRMVTINLKLTSLTPLKAINETGLIKTTSINAAKLDKLPCPFVCIRSRIINKFVQVNGDKTIIKNEYKLFTKK